MLSVEQVLAMASPGSHQPSFLAGSDLAICVDTPENQGPCKRVRQAGGPTSPAAASSCSHTAQWLSAGHSQLWSWLERLQSLHVACLHIPNDSVLLAIGLFREYSAQTGMSYQYALMQPLIAQTALCVCMWAAIKFLTNPGAVPNSRFMAKATGLPHHLLTTFEPEVLKAVGWSIWGIAKSIGLERPAHERAAQEEPSFR